MPEDTKQPDAWICQECKKNGTPKNVSWVIFAWAIGIFVIVIGWAFARTESLSIKVESSQANISEMRVDIGQIKTDVSWIKETLKSVKSIK